MLSTLEVVNLALSAFLTAFMGAMLKVLMSFIKEQREANEANKLANRSMQRDVLYRYFRIVVEEGKPITPEEFAHVEECYTAYHANGGNGAGTLMFQKIRENVIINTGREVTA